jgi:hypothetical protein
MKKNILPFISILFCFSSSYAQNSQDFPSEPLEHNLHVEQLIPNNVPLADMILEQNSSMAIIRYQNPLFYSAIVLQGVEDPATLQIIAAWFSGVDLIPDHQGRDDLDDNIIDNREAVWSNIDDAIFQDETKSISDFNKLRMQGENLNDEVLRLIGVIITRHNKRVTADNLIRIRPERTDMIDLFFKKFIEKGLLKDFHEALCYRKYLFPREGDEE